MNQRGLVSKVAGTIQSCRPQILKHFVRNFAGSGPSALAHACSRRTRGAVFPGRERLHLETLYLGKEGPHLQPIITRLSGSHRLVVCRRVVAFRRSCDLSHVGHLLHTTAA